MARNLPLVIEAMVKAIPVEGNNDLLNELQSIHRSATYSAPENIRMWWTRTAEALEDGVGDPTGVDWKEKVAGLFADQIKVGA